MKKVDFLIVYEIRPRELDHVCLLAYELRRRGYTVEILNSWYCLTHNYDMPDVRVAVVSACYVDGVYTFFAGHANTYEKVLDLQWEQLRYRFMLDIDRPSNWNFSGVPCETRHVSWGESNRQRLLLEGVQDDCARVCGYLPLDFYRPEFSGFFYSREELFHKYGLDPDKKTALFISSFSHVGIPKSQIDSFTGDEQKMLRRLHTKSQKKILSWIFKYLKTHEDTQIIYRPHPSEKGNAALIKATQKYPNFKVISDESIKQWLKQCDIILNWCSTSAIESYFCKKPTLLLQPLPIPESLSYTIFDNCTPLTSYKAFAQAVASAHDGQPFPMDTELLRDFYSIEDTPTYIRICDWLEETLHDPDYHSPDLRDEEYLSARSAPRTPLDEQDQTPDVIFTKEKVAQNYATPQEIEAIIDKIGRVLTPPQ